MLRVAEKFAEAHRITPASSTAAAILVLAEVLAESLELSKKMMLEARRPADEHK